MTDRHQDPSYPLRMPKDLRALLEEAAATSGRSVNAEIVARLRQSFKTQPSQALKQKDVVAIVKATLDELQQRELLRKPAAKRVR